MDLRKRMAVALAAVCMMAVGIAHAEQAPAIERAPDVSAFALPSALELGADFVPADQPASVAVSGGENAHGPSVLQSAVDWLPKPRVYDVRYQPRRSRDRGWGRRSYSESVTQFHAGFFDPEGDLNSRFLAGLRVGPMVDPHVQIGLGADWAHEGDNTSSVTRRTIGPGGTPIEVRQDLARASSDFIPIAAFLQISADDNMPVVPFFGVSAGYQVLVLSADDFTTGQSFDGTFGGWGWQAWGGGAIPLSGRTRVTGEIFVNGAELSRDVDDFTTGQTIRESVDANGMGMRFGLSWGF